MGFWAFLGGFLAVAIGIAAVVIFIRKKIRSFSSQIFGRPDLLGALKDVDTAHLDTPRSLNGCDKLLMPQILKDFPDFDATLSKTYARNILNERFGHQQNFTIHNIVIAKYLRSNIQKTIVFQAATCHRENGQPVQKRYDLHYTHMLASDTESVAANCPNCGGAMGYGITVCPYCNSRVANVLGNTWKFTEIKET